MTFIDMINNFNISSKDNFPVKDCAIQDKRDRRIFDSNKAYLCITFARQTQNKYCLTVCTPYICKESDEVITYGWVDKSKNVYGNLENSTQLWSEFVIGFIEYDENNADSDLNARRKFNNCIDEQWDKIGKG